MNKYVKIGIAIGIAVAGFVVYKFIKKKKDEKLVESIESQVGKGTVIPYSKTIKSTGTTVKSTVSTTKVSKTPQDIRNWKKGDKIYVSSAVTALRNDGKEKISLAKDEYAGDFDVFKQTSEYSVVWVRRANRPGFNFVLSSTNVYKK